MSVFDRLWNSLSGRPGSTRQNLPAQPDVEPKTESSGAERRRLPRVRVLSALEGYGVEAAVKVTIREISLGGFSAESPVTFPVGSEQTFLFSTGDGTETMGRCECRHVKAGVNGSTTSVVGFQFLPNQDESLQLVVNLYKELRKRFPTPEP